MKFVGGRHPERGNLFPSRMGITSNGQVNAMGFLFKRSFEALAEIFDFVAGLVQRVPKKPNEMKADLQSSTAPQGDCVPIIIPIIYFTFKPIYCNKSTFNV